MVLGGAPPPRPFNAQARTLYAAARFRDKQLLVVPGRVHGTGMLELGDEAPKVLAAVRGFIDDRTGHCNLRHCCHPDL